MTATQETGLTEKYTDGWCLLFDIESRQNSFSSIRSSEDVKALGQYFTNAVLAEFMAAQISVNVLGGQPVKLLDPGAGFGILIAAASIKMLNSEVNDLEVCAYELDPNVISHLKGTLQEIQVIFQLKGKRFNYRIIEGDFILSQPNEKFDVVIMNPPYFKYNSQSSVYAKKTSELFKGDPNIYASFLAVAIHSLAEEGQLVAISPRSFFNGLYFKGFRKYLLEKTDLTHIHIFKSRRDAFKDAKVLQENVIFRVAKSDERRENVTVSRSESHIDLNKRETLRLRREIIVDASTDQMMIRVPENDQELRALEIVSRFESNFDEIGYFISTGPVVEYRATDFIVSASANKTGFVPLIRPHNLSGLAVQWSANNGKDLGFGVQSKNKKQLLNNSRYVLLKRVTAKDEKRRLVAGIWEPQPKFKLLGISNKVNYVGVIDGELSTNEALGLLVVFSSTLMDRYFRCISGSTQVNATDVRVLKFPSRYQVLNIGNRASILGGLTQQLIDQLFLTVLDEE